MPVADEALDNVVGIVDVREALRDGEERFRSPGASSRRISVPDTATLSQAIVDMVRRPCRMLLIVDEHGGVDGLVTSPSLLDAISAPDAARSRRDADGSILLSASLSIPEANGEIESRRDPQAGAIRIPAGDDYQTVAGFVLERLGRIPETGDHVSLAGAIVRVEALEGHRITRVRIMPGPPAPPA